MILSIVCIVITIFVYLCLPDLLNVHGQCLLGYLICLVIGYSLLIAVQITPPTVHPTVCTVIGYLIYVDFLSAFLWVNAISYDIWHKFR